VEFRLDVYSVTEDPFDAEFCLGIDGDAEAEVSDCLTGERGDSLVLYVSVLGVFLDVSIRYRTVLVQVATPVLNQSMSIGCQMHRCAKFLDLGYGFENLEHGQP
jgi:hypothetical protein